MYSSSHEVTHTLFDLMIKVGFLIASTCIGLSGILSTTETLYDKGFDHNELWRLPAANSLSVTSQMFRPLATKYEVYQPWFSIATEETSVGAAAAW